MSGRSINSDDKKIKKSEFYKSKNIFDIDDIDVNKSYAKNNSLIHFIGYNDNDVIGSLCLKPSQMTGYINKFKENIKIFLRVKDKENF